MSLKLNERYPGRYNNPSADYPLGSFKNRTAPGAKDGSYLEQDWANDKEGFFQSLLSLAGITPNGSVDKVGASQFFDALQRLKQNQVGTAYPTTGPSAALVLTPGPAISAYAAGQRFRVKFNRASTGTDTLNISGAGAKPLKQYDSTGAKVAAVFAIDQLADVEYDGTDVVLLDQLPATPVTTLPITKQYVSSPQAFTRAGLVTVPHGLGVNPKIITGTLICQTAENGWLAGDRQHIALIPDNDDSTVVSGFGARADITNIYVRCGANGPYGFNINNGATVSSTTDANWRLELRAYA